MTDAEIIKALECCGNNDCEGCPLHTGQGCRDGGVGTNDILDLINRQKAEIERLQKHIAEQNAEVERLSKVDALPKRGFFNLLCGALVYTKTLEEYNNFRKDIKAEAIKEFADKLDTYIMWHFPIDNPVVEGILAKLKDLIKEMTERQKNDFKRNGG